jgi:transposase
MTQVDLNERGIYPIFWPAFSPDLNPIATVWDRMKDYIERHYPEDVTVTIGRTSEQTAITGKTG